MEGGTSSSNTNEAKRSSSLSSSPSAAGVVFVPADQREDGSLNYREQQCVNVLASLGRDGELSVITTSMNSNEPESNSSSLRRRSPGKGDTVFSRDQSVAPEREPLLSGHQQQIDRIKYVPSPNGFISVYIWTVIIASICAAFICQCLSYVILFPLYIGSRRFRAAAPGIILRFFQLLAVCWLNPFWKFKCVRPPPKGYRPSDTLVMTNHLSAVDPWITNKALFPWEMKYVFKSDLMKIPIAGWSIYLAQDLPIQFTKEKGGWGTKPGCITALMERVRYLHTVGIGTVVFPEGTRSKTGRLQAFKDGFFRFALETGCEILPMATHNQQSLWPLGSTFMGSGTVYYAFGDPLRPTAEDTVESLKDKTWNQVAALLEMCPSFDPEGMSPSNQSEQTRGKGIFG